jgi:peptide/nickel transport system substrate-binding protein
MKKLTVTLATLAALAAAPAFAQKSKDTLRFPVFDPDAGIDTYTMPSSFANVWGPSAYDMLLGFDPKDGKFVGHLAKSYSQPNPTTYEFEIRDDVKWHDGQKFTADDVVYTLQYLTDPKVKLRYKSYWQWIKSIEKVGANKVRVTANVAAPDSLMYLAMRTPIYPKHLHGAVENKIDFAIKPVGTGPLRIVQMDKNAGIIGEKYKDYVPSKVKPPSGVGRVVAQPIKDMGTLTATLMTGGADVATDLPPDQADALVKTGNFETTLGPPSTSYYFIEFPATAWVNNKALGDIRVRRAILMAINRDALVKVKYGPLASHLKPEAGLCSKEQLGCGFTKTAYKYDPAAAKKLLAEAGYADGFDVTINCFPINATESEAISGMLRAVGIRASVRQHPTAQRQQLFNEGKVEIGNYGWSGGGMFEVSGNLGRHVESNDYGDPELARLAQPAATMLDDAQRRVQVAKVFDRITDQAYAEPTDPNRPVFVHTKEVVLNARTIRAEQVNPHEFGWK